MRAPLARIQQWYAEGLEALRRGDVAQSLNYWELITKEDGSESAALQNLVFCHLKLEHYEEVLRLVPVGLALDSQNLELRRLRAQAALQKEEFAVAMEDAETVLIKDPSDAEMAQVLIFSAIFMSDLTRAESANKRALKAHPDHPIFQFAACKLALLHGNLNEASRLMLSLLERHAGEPKIQELAADLYLARGEIAESRRHLEEVIRLGAASIKTQNSLGWLEFGAGRYQQALQRFSESILANEAQTEAYIGAGYCHFKANNLAEAQICCNKGIRYSPKDIRNWELLFCIAEARKDRHSAMRALKEIHQLDPQGLTDSGKKAKAFYQRK